MDFKIQYNSKIYLYSVGLIHPTESGYHVKATHDYELSTYKRIVTKDNIIYGVQMIGDTRYAREAASHIKNKENCLRMN